MWDSVCALLTWLQRATTKTMRSRLQRATTRHEISYDARPQRRATSLVCIYISRRLFCVSWTIERACVLSQQMHCVDKTQAAKREEDAKELFSVSSCLCILLCAMTHSCVCHDSFMFMAWLSSCLCQHTRYTTECKEPQHKRRAAIRLRIRESN